MFYLAAVYIALFLPQRTNMSLRYSPAKGDIRQAIHISNLQPCTDKQRLQYTHA
jgi:hypothetical protein